MLELLDGLTEQQWHAATLCEGWDVQTLVAHLVVRETQPLPYGSAMVTGGKIGPHPKDLLRKARARGPQSLVRSLRAGPPLLYRLPGPPAMINLVENWVHNEDLRRGALQQPRTSSPETQQALWLALHVVARLMLRSITRAGIVALVQPSGKALAFHTGTGFPTKADPAEAAARIVGEPGEIVLFLFGRKAAAQVALEGDPQLVNALRNEQMSI
jgi:uncharacterized protein (TIGR03085 family)